MLDVEQRAAILALTAKGRGVRTVARLVGASRNAVRRVLAEGKAVRERHRRACQRWHEHNGHLEREGRVAERMAAPPRPSTSAGSTGAADDLTARIEWSAVERRVAPPLAVILRELLRLVSDALRDERRAQAAAIPAKSARVPPREVRDEIGPPTPGPVGSRPTGTHATGASTDRPSLRRAAHRGRDP